MELSFESFEAARERILGFGRGVEVLEPRAMPVPVSWTVRRMAGHVAEQQA